MTQPDPKPLKVREGLTWLEAFVALGALIVVGAVILGSIWLLVR